MIIPAYRNGIWFPVRRDCPEIILPDAGSSAGMTPGVVAANAAADTLSAYGEICSTTEFGTSPLLIIGMIATMRSGAAITGVNTSVALPRLAIFELTSGAASSEVTPSYFRIPFGSSAFGQQSANTDGVTVTNGIGNAVLYLEGPPRLLPGSQRLAYRLEMHDAGAQRVSACYGIAYDPAKLAFSNTPIDFSHYLRGGNVFRSLASDYATATSSTTQGVNGAYVTINVAGGATLDADYLIRSMTFSPNAANLSATHKICDLAIGTAGNEVVQARTGVGGVIIQYGGVHHQFKYPIIAYKGETLRWAVRDTSTSALDYDIILGLEKLGV